MADSEENLGSEARIEAVRAAAEERGRQSRKNAPRSSHESWAPAADRPDPVDVLEAQAADRVPELVPVRYGRMLASPFTFYRGGAVIMANDLAHTPVSGIRVQLCGDAHLSNFGAFGSPDRSLIFDINDFDETLPGPWEWDVQRLVASVEIAGRDRDFGRKQRMLASQSAATGYREQMRKLAKMGNLEAWYTRVDVDELGSRFADQVEAEAMNLFKQNVAKAKRKDSARAFSKLTEMVDGELRIVSDPPLITPLEDLLPADELDHAEGEIRRMFGEYKASLPPGIRELLERYHYVHSAHKVVGVGSVGTRAWIVLFIGSDQADPLFLQLKQAQRSVLEPFTRKSAYKRQGRRVVVGQRLMQSSGDILLGWMSINGIDGTLRDFYVRQLWDSKGSARIELMSARSLAMYARLCGGVLANAHARSGDRLAIASYLGGGDRFDRAMADFAARYGDQNEKDYAELKAAADSGRIKVDYERS